MSLTMQRALFGELHTVPTDTLPWVIWYVTLAPVRIIALPGLQAQLPAKSQDLYCVLPCGMTCCTRATLICQTQTLVRKFSRHAWVLKGTSDTNMQVCIDSTWPTLPLPCLPQARNNARVVVAGSLEMFSNEFFDVQVWSQGEW